MSNNIKISILVLNHSKALRAVENINYLLRQKTDFGFKIFAIDNSCNSSQIDILKNGTKNNSNIELIINSKNLGYTKGHNKIKGNEEGEYIFIINPDVLLKEDNAIQKMVDYMERHSDIAILGPKQIDDTGEITMSVRAFPKFYIQVARRTFLRELPILKSKVAHDEMRHLDYSKIQDVDWLQSSCFIVRKDFWKKIGGFNEWYFLFMGDTEMCLRAWEMGYRVVYYPEIKVYADGKRLSAGGIKQIFSNWLVRQHIIDSLKYRLKYFWRNNPRTKYYQSKNK